MKTVMCMCLLLLTSSLYVQAQNGETKYLFGPNGVKIGGFGGPTVEISNITNQTAISTGGGGGVIFNKRLFVGLHGMSVASNISRTYMDNNNNTLTSCIEFGYGGLWVGYNFNPESLLHFTADVKLGGGRVSYTQNNSYNNYYNNSLYNASCYVVNPNLGVELNVFKYMRISASAGYRFVNGL